LLFEQRYTNARAAWNLACLAENDPATASTVLYQSLTFGKPSYDNLLALLPLAAAGAFPREVEAAQVYVRLPAPESVLLWFVELHGARGAVTRDQAAVERDLLRLSKILEDPLTAEREKKLITFDLKATDLPEIREWFLEKDLALAGSFWGLCMRSADYRLGNHNLAHQFLGAMYELLDDRLALLKARKGEVDAISKFENLFPPQKARLDYLLPLALRDASELEQWREWDTMFRLAQSRKLLSEQDLTALRNEADTKRNPSAPAAASTPVTGAEDVIAKLRKEALQLQNEMVSVDTAESFRDAAVGRERRKAPH
jgi:hypothetical protein